MASKELCEDFYALLGSPNHSDNNLGETERLPTDYETESRPSEQEMSPWAKPALERKSQEQKSQDQANRLRVQGLLNELFAKFNINPRLFNPHEHKINAVGLDERVATLLVRSDLEATFASTDTPEPIRIILEQRLLKHMGCEGDSHFSDIIATQQKLLMGTEGVDFWELDRIFLPGEIVYTADSAPIHQTLYEQCWMVTSCEHGNENYSNSLTINGVKWCFDPAEVGWYLASAKVMIYAYDGRRNMTLDAFGVVPLQSLPSEEKKSIEDKMIARGSLYVEISQVDVRCFQYNGPASWPKNQYDGMFRTQGRSLFKKLSKWMWWHRIVSSRNLLVLRNMSLANQHFSGIHDRLTRES